MDYIKPYLIISQLEENPDNLDKACFWTLHKEYGENQHAIQGQMSFSSRGRVNRIYSVYDSSYSLDSCV